ncbi:nucleotidyltransferase family protein [Pseudooceanicola sp. CBS1P-1]|uniref:NTP transferase domain-containing protein n=1 Tax=Pseudooceanicola albus TaxID=2692189 RepID=A0A6L7FZA7_9RHOB|nr:MULTISPECIES: nucleotidyltransferase family protein [Pseudooceanicola]MBT9385728.1 nucleotidyltransferase family protein [Pseudooceanicola endophyticus]MXN16762.1 NTP transferase domain-containing protein [Pseudooceanicola albus]
MRDTPLALMLFAAGHGTRMRPLTNSRPKPLIEVAGRPLIAHALDQTRDLALPRTVANAHYLGDQIAAHFAGTPVQVSPEAALLDTGGGLRHALPLLGEGPVFTLNTDAVWKGPAALSLLARHWDPARMDALLLGIPPANAIGHAGQGDFTPDAEGRITRGPGLIYSGAQITTTQDLAAIPETAFSLNAVWDRMIARGRLFILPYPGLWCDVGRPEAISLAEEMLSADV